MLTTRMKQIISRRTLPVGRLVHFRLTVMIVLAAQMFAIAPCLAKHKSTQHKTVRVGFAPAHSTREGTWEWKFKGYSVNKHWNGKYFKYSKKPVYKKEFTPLNIVRPPTSQNNKKKPAPADLPDKIIRPPKAPAKASEKEPPARPDKIIRPHSSAVKSRVN